jgi:hypothetical protein
MSRFRLLAAALALVAVLALPASSPAVEYGMGDELPTMFGAPLFKDLGLRKARYVVAYDAALTESFERQQADGFLRAAHAAGYELIVSFEHSRLPRKAKQLPSQRAYQRGVRAFMRRYPYVRIFSPWDEINDCSQPTCRSPKVAARYFLTMKRTCGGCTVMAAEVLDTPNPPLLMVTYLQQYMKVAAKGRPALWGLHNYSDVNRFRSTGTRDMLQTVKGAIWITESGGLYSFTGFPPSLARQERAEKQMFTLAKLSPRIQRLYIWSWTGGGLFDAGLTNVDGTPRPAYDVVRDALRG